MHRRMAESLEIFCRRTLKPPRRKENRRTGGQLSEWICQSSSRRVCARHRPGVPSTLQSGDGSGYHERRRYWRCYAGSIWLKHTTTTIQWPAWWTTLSWWFHNRIEEGPGNQRHLQLCREWQITSLWCQSSQTRTRRSTTCSHWWNSLFPRPEAWEPQASSSPETVMTTDPRRYTL